MKPREILNDAVEFITDDCEKIVLISNDNNKTLVPSSVILSNNQTHEIMMEYDAYLVRDFSENEYLKVDNYLNRIIGSLNNSGLVKTSIIITAKESKILSIKVSITLDEPATKEIYDSIINKKIVVSYMLWIQKNEKQFPNREERGNYERHN